MQINQRLIIITKDSRIATFDESAKFSIVVKISRSKAKLSAQMRKIVVIRFVTIAAMKRF